MALNFTCPIPDAFDTRIAVYPGSACPTSATAVTACSDNFTGCAGSTSKASWAVTAGSTWYVRRSLSSGVAELSFVYGRPGLPRAAALVTGTAAGVLALWAFYSSHSVWQAFRASTSAIGLIGHSIPEKLKALPAIQGEGCVVAADGGFGGLDARGENRSLLLSRGQLGLQLVEPSAEFGDLLLAGHNGART